MRLICLMVFCAACIQPAWGLSVKIKARVLPRCESNEVASAVDFLSPSSHRNCRSQAAVAHVYFRSEHQGLQMVRRMVLEY
jgi:hypothetical protein